MAYPERDQTCNIFNLFQMLSQDANPGVEFEYSLPSGAVKETPEGGETYEWQQVSGLLSRLFFVTDNKLERFQQFFAAGMARSFSTVTIE